MASEDPASMLSAVQEDVAHEIELGAPPFLAPRKLRTALTAVFDAVQWRDLLTAQDDFVANLFENKLALQNRLVELRNQLRELEDEVEKYRNEYQDLNKAIDEDQSKLAFLESQRREAAERREEAKHGTKPGRKTLKRVGPPVTLVLINGSVASFADKLIHGGKDGGKKASEMLRNEVQLESGTAAESETVMMVWLWYNRQDLIARLQADRVITVSSTWNTFAQGFARIVGNMLVDVDRNPVAEHMTVIVTKFGFMGNVEKIYLAGAHPDMTLLPLVVQDEEGPPEELEKAFEEVVLPKIVLIDHRPHEPKEDLGGPTVTFAGLFDSSSSRPIIPPIQSDLPQQGNDSFIASVVSVPAASPRCCEFGGLVRLAGTQGR